MIHLKSQTSPRDAEAVARVFAKPKRAPLSLFDSLPDSAFVRESQLVQSPKRPDIPVPLPFSAPTLWRLVKAGRFPKPVKLSQRVTAWNIGAVRAWIAAQTDGTV